MDIKKKMHIVDYREAAFIGDRKPCINTLKNWIKSGRLPGEKLGGRYYVYIESPIKMTKTGNAIADSYLDECGMI